MVNNLYVFEHFLTGSRAIWFGCLRYLLNSNMRRSYPRYIYRYIYYSTVDWFNAPLSIVVYATYVQYDSVSQT